MTGDGHDERAILRTMGANLPRYMVPSRVVALESFPQNSNGKIDRKALRAELDAQAKAEG